VPTFGDLSYHDDGSGEPVVFLHNSLTSHEIFPLGNYRALRLDFRAHGDNQKVIHQMHAEQLAVDVIAMVDHARVERFTIVGSSIGATVALLVAERHPDRVARLILMGVNAEKATPLERLSMGAVAALVERTGAFDFYVSRALPLLFSKHTPASIQKPWAEHIKRYDRRALAAAMRCWINRPQLIERATRIQAPTTLLAGVDDTSCPPANARKLVMPNASLQLVERAGHMLPLERPEVLAALIQRGA
jgi:3-oxoadipate enol-lactonase